MDPVRLCTLELTHEEFVLLDAIVDHIVDESRRHGLELNQARAQGLLVSSLVGHYLEQSLALIDRDTKPDKENDE